MYRGKVLMNNLFLQGLHIDWDKIEEDSYLRNIEALRELKDFSFDSPISFFVGENGTGKSTLLEAIAVAYGFNPEGGTKNFNFSTYDDHSELHDAIRLSKGFNKPGWGYFLRAESFFNVASKEDEYTCGNGDKLHYQSHGESFLAVAQNHFKANGMYILDEPEAALSPQRQLTFLLEIYNCVKEGSQFIIVTHSPILLGMPDADIFTFDDGKIHKCNYEDTDSYQVTKMFIDNREALLYRLFSE